MNQAERYGAMLVMYVRREHQLMQEIDSVKAKIQELVETIRADDSGLIYASTGEIPVVIDEPAAPADPVRMPERVPGGGWRLPPEPPAADDPPIAEAVTERFYVPDIRTRPRCRCVDASRPEDDPCPVHGYDLPSRSRN